MRTVILKTRQNFSWTSMQEILPSLESLWLEACEKKGHEVNILNVDDNSPRTHARQLIAADLIIVTAFNVSVTNYLLFLRKGLKNDCPWVFYLHGLATIAFWPPLMLGLKKFIYMQDIFIGTCYGDAICLQNTFKEFNYHEVPFFLDKLKVEEFDCPQLDLNFHYVGRISPQKNLNTLIEAFAIFQKKNNSSLLHIFGEEDHLGHPNMGISCDDYLEQLMKLVSSKKLKENVFFHGFVKREKIQYLQNSLDKNKNFFISLTTHSDENFGMAAIRALNSGWRCLLSNWGGHKNFFNRFKNQSLAVDCFINENGPGISVNLVAAKLEQLIELPLIIDRNDFFIYSNALSIATNVLDTVKVELGVISLTDKAYEILERKKTWSKDPQQVFQGYGDSYARPFLNAYLIDRD